MKKSSSKLKEIETAIKHLSPEEQRRLLSRFTRLFQTQKIGPEDLEWLKAAEQAFSFWDNPEDEIYDAL
ncbi:MAG: hypothetical protein A2V67_13035 [Deltaproteobacteria bacterium RBG_13_61_14]|nr:MAG: hypothetical protein A2V67_13035 [Deltaproteobacteria bacterium RBG_13_61_14]